MTKKILIRIDDVCPTMNWEQFEKAIKLMDALNIRPLIGVIPDCKDSDLMICDVRNDFWDYIKDLQQRGYTIAMHGLYHTFNSHYRGNIVSRHDSEFAGLSLDTQIHMIQKGKEILNKHGINTQIFLRQDIRTMIIPLRLYLYAVSNTCQTARAIKHIKRRH